ncbi:ribosome biogenesis GTPase YlqF [Oenococcus kitaharae]|uniref:Ribosome biogenesis GTPase A n=1 Tax=Oenococcus kitaharae DSM 17330 TaxID=1045004 RepID=G9WH22_9LACO|nr:ribosome biogenesis GTPase YlqF [Oenococcus kitaharae]EHN59511.1 50S ribosomal subunit maturation GTPase [Oenococcus kitaharae DSM 17330]OEY83367.1 GTPase [Oenococcus kitaharae]OEY85166.1 GTPase [Oenococcus kitaharae]OEY86021.1 GTPase [Oenococcus kitaharae]
MTQQIQWFPGHMAKTIREIGEQMKLVDFSLEIVDARAPESTQNPQIMDSISVKPVFLILNKIDLADARQVHKFVAANKDKFAGILTTDAKMGLLSKDFLRQLKTNPVYAKMVENKKAASLKALVVGTPNVGKSTFINHLAGKNIARTANTPGVTRFLYWIRTKYDLDFLDTPGLLWPKFENQEIGTKIGILGGIKDTLLAPDDLALWLISFIQKNYPTVIATRYKISHFPLDNPIAALMSITSQLGMRQDFEKASLKIINDFRSGKFGQISLDFYGDDYIEN